MAATLEPPTTILRQASAALGCVLGFSRESWLVSPSDDPLAALHAAALLLALLWAHGTRRNTPALCRLCLCVRRAGPMSSEGEALLIGGKLTITLGLTL